LPSTYVYIDALAVSGANLFAGTGDGGVFRSSNNGASWTAASTGLTDTSVYAFAVSGENLFAGTYRGGVFRSSDNGASWMAASTGLTGVQVIALAVSGANLFAGTRANGVWRRPLSEMINTVGERVQPARSALQVYPNPFEKSATIRFTMEDRGPVRICVVNLLGQPVALLFEGELNAGEHSFEWDAQDAAPGAYFAIIRERGSIRRVGLSLTRGEVQASSLR
jgi:hypothetical protein